MTMLFSTATERMITMTADSAVTLDFEAHREYETGRKSYRFPGIGVVTTWGARDGNLIGQHLDKRGADLNSVTDLTNAVHEYLTQDYRPKERWLNDVGYHVAGFDPEGKPRLLHVFWGVDRPNRSGSPPKYAIYDHSPKPGTVQLLYNGRNDLADIVARKLIEEIQQGADLRFDLKLPTDQARLGDFVARFAAELTPEVGPPFLTIALRPDNSIGSMRNDRLCPVSEENLTKCVGP